MRKTFALPGFVAVAAVAAISLAPVASAKKTVKYKFTCQGGLVGSSQAGGPCTSNKFGKGKFLLDLAKIPNFTTVYKLKGGTIKMKGVLKLGANGINVGTYKITGGTGKFKGAKGKGKVNADTRPGKSSIDKGTITF